MLRILHTADIHLDAPFGFLGSKGAAHRRQIRETFTRITTLAAEERYDLLLIAGDLFNSNHPARETQHFLATVLAAVPCTVCILPGNHDFLDRRSVYHKLALPPNVHLLAQRPTYLELPELDLMVAGNPIESKHDDSPQLKDITRGGDARWFVAMAHGNMKIPGPFESTSRPIESEAISATKADYIALGDWHRYTNYSHGGVAAYYSGAPEPTSVSQNKTGSVASVILSGQGISVESVKVGIVQAQSVEIDVTGLTEEEVVTAVQAQAGSNLMMTVTLRGMKSAANLLDLETIHGATAAGFYWLQIKDNAAFSFQDLDPNDYPEVFVIGQYVRLLANRIEEAGDEREKRLAEGALQLGVALLKGHKVL